MAARSGHDGCKKAFRWLGACLVAGVFIFGIVVVTGIYSVAASVPHLPPTRAFIEFALHRSVAFHSGGVEQPDLDDPGLVRLGARYFEFGCAPCHGSPASPRNPISRQMLPAAPPLAGAAEDWTPQELRWIVHNGLKYTGMPAWAGERRNREVWPLVAFLQALPDMDSNAYRAAAAMDRTDAEQVEFEARETGMAEFCETCHGGADAAPVSTWVPSLSGQSELYLRRAMSEYADGTRQSGMMEPLAAALSDSRVETRAPHFASLAPSQGSREISWPAHRLQRGRRIAQEGTKENDIPACLGCHSDAGSARFPKLAGLSADYLTDQLELFRQGVRNRSTYGAVMTAIARRLTPEQMKDVAAYFAAGADGTTEESPATGREAMR